MSPSGQNDRAAAKTLSNRKLSRRGGAFGKIIGLAVLSVVASGCSLIPKPPSTIYDLTAPTNPRVRSGTNAQILVPTPSTFKALNTDRIAARPDSNEYAYLPRAVWSDTLPSLLQARLVDTLQNTKRVKAVGIPGQGLLIDYQIVIDVRAFEIRRDGARAEFAVQLMNDRTGRIVARKIFTETAPVLDATNTGYVAALDTAMDKSFVAITAWVLARI